MRGTMDHTITAIERAFQLAKSGSYATITDIRKQLTAEGYGVGQITWGALLKQLKALIKAARSRILPKGP